MFQRSETLRSGCRALRLWLARANPGLWRGYATRLGLWGPETAFANREAFVADIRDGGIAAMELVARDLKSLGLYTARALSFAGVEYEILEHCLTEDQIAVYDAYAEAWAIIHANLREALEAMAGSGGHSIGLILVKWLWNATLAVPSQG